MILHQLRRVNIPLHLMSCRTGSQYDRGSDQRCGASVPSMRRWQDQLGPCIRKTAMALELRPTCEHCNKALPPEADDAMICSFECTFCKTCVEEMLDNVCPNCGGGFSPRPIRPAANWRGRQLHRSLSPIDKGA